MSWTKGNFSHKENPSIQASHYSLDLIWIHLHSGIWNAIPQVESFSFHRMPSTLDQHARYLPADWRNHKSARTADGRLRRNPEGGQLAAGCWLRWWAGPWLWYLQTWNLPGLIHAGSWPLNLCQPLTLNSAWLCLLVWLCVSLAGLRTDERSNQALPSPQVWQAAGLDRQSVIFWDGHHTSVKTFLWAWYEISASFSSGPQDLYMI